MVKKSKANFVCSSCGHSQPAWTGKCPQCGEWNTFEEIIESVSKAAIGSKEVIFHSINEIAQNKSKNRITTDDKQLDLLLGGGFMPGGVVLLAGQPGIGKSTLLLQIAHQVSARNSVLYVSGEESLHQVASRAKRLGTLHDSLKLASSSSADDIARTIATGEFSFVIVDSIQTISCNDIASSAGTVSQITNSTRMLTESAKAHDVCLVIVGHVTKEGSIAGPKILEHSVDAVLQLEGDRYGGFKILRSIKNRFGSTNESALYEMKNNGLQSVDNPSAALLKERYVTDGSVVLATMEGSRPLLVEIQALVNRTSYGYPKRTASGFDINRLNLLIAMLERRTKLKLSDKDIYVNTVGGINISEPAADLAICMAIASADKGMQLKKNAVVFGELGLGGELRHVPFIEKRISEAKKLGFDAVIGPNDSEGKKNSMYASVSDIKDALNSFLEKDGSR